MGSVNPPEKAAIATLRCVGRLASTGERCPHPARPGTRRCGFHRSVPPDGRRCLHVDGSGWRCENWRKPKSSDSGVETCGGHMRQCETPDCTRRIARLAGKCRPCRSRQRLTDLAAQAPQPRTRNDRWDLMRERFPRCAIRHTGKTGAPCRGLATQAGNPFCQKHRNLPDDASRCTHKWEDGHRCPKRWTTAGDRRCPDHSTKPGKGSAQRGKYKGSEPVFRPCKVCGKISKGVLGCAEHAPPCAGENATRKQCGRTGTVEIDGRAYCKTHSKRHVTPPPPHPKGGRRFTCGEPSGLVGDPCRSPVSTPDGRCHHHAAERPDEERCTHMYANGKRCPNRRIRRKHHVHCNLHHQPGARPTVPCMMTIALTGAPCGKQADPATSICGTHIRLLAALETDPRARCQHKHPNGARCTAILPTNGNQQFLVLCQWHCTPCTAPGCTGRSGMADGLCRAHRPRCGRPLANGATCEAAGYGPEEACYRHRDEERCALRTNEDEPCLLPAQHDTPDGRICTAHYSNMPSDDERCDEVHPDGVRCAARRDRGTYWCGRHRNGKAVQCEAISAHTGERCTDMVVPRPGCPNFCATHSRELPDEERCTHMYDSGGRCTGARMDGLDRCRFHAESVSCGVTTPSGDPCDRPVILRIGQGAHAAFCFSHRELPKPHLRCTHILPNGDRCPSERADAHTLVCRLHLAARPWCAAVDTHGVCCGWRAAAGSPYCDRHVNWTPGQPLTTHKPDDLWRFFVRPNSEYIWETLQAYAAESAVLAELVHSPESAATLDLSQVGVWTVGEVMDLERIRQIDPYDLTGAQRSYLENLEFGFTEEELALAAERMLQRYAPNTLRALTGRMKGYLKFCQERHLVPVPAERSTITRYLSYLTIKAIDDHGQPLQASSLDQLRDALRQAHEIAGYENPWTRWPVLSSELRGYGRLYSRPVTQAHAIRLPELAALIGAAHSTAGISPRDHAILTIVADTEVKLSLRAAAALTWDDIVIPNSGGAQPATLTIGRKVHDVPNRAAEPLGSDAGIGANEIPISVRICGVTALRSLAAQLIAEGKPVTGPVFRKDDGTHMSKSAVHKIIGEAAKQAGLAPATTYTVDERIQLLDAAAQPDPIGIRDAAIMNLMWWGSLRRSEVGPRTISDLAHDSQGRGIVLLVKKSKTDVNGEYVPLPWVNGVDGNPLPTDTWRAITEWFAIYERLIGRPLTDDDPIFINIHRDLGTPMSADGVGDVISRYATKAGITAELGERISSHGFRAGYATEALARGIPSESLAKTQRRKDTRSLLGYNRPANPYETLLTHTLDTSEDTWDRYERAKLQT